VIEHKLLVHPDVKLVSQNLQKQSMEQQNFVSEEIKKLLDADLIHVVHQPEWLLTR
jgi:hypothetical protein